MDVDLGVDTDAETDADADADVDAAAVARAANLVVGLKFLAFGGCAGSRLDRELKEVEFILWGCANSQFNQELDSLMLGRLPSQPT